MASYILDNATPRSLIIIDELGRGIAARSQSQQDQLHHRRLNAAAGSPSL